MTLIPLDWCRYVIKRELISEATEVSIDVGRLTNDKIDLHLSDVREALAQRDVHHINVKPHTRDTYIRRRSFIMSGEFFYHIELDDMTSGNALRHLKLLKKHIEDVVQWSQSNCVGDFDIVPQGIEFHSPEDAVLYKMTFA